MILVSERTSRLFPVCPLGLRHGKIRKTLRFLLEPLGITLSHGLEPPFLEPEGADGPSTDQRMLDIFVDKAMRADSKILIRPVVVVLRYCALSVDPSAFLYLLEQRLKRTGSPIRIGSALLNVVVIDDAAQMPALQQAHRTGKGSIVGNPDALGTFLCGSAAFQIVTDRTPETYEM